MRLNLKGLTALAFGLAAGSILVQAGTRNNVPANPESAVRALLDAQQTAWNEGKVDTCLDGYWKSDALTFAGSQGIIRGFAGVQERYRKSYPDRQAMGRLSFSELEFRALGLDAALVLGHWHLTRDKGDIGGVFSLVFQRFPEGWRIIHDHTSVVPGA